MVANRYHGVIAWFGAQSSCCCLSSCSAASPNRIRSVSAATAGLAMRRSILADDLGWTAPAAFVWWNTRTPQVCCAAFATACWTPPCSPSTKRCCCRTARRSSTRRSFWSPTSQRAPMRCSPAPLTNIKDLAGQRIGVENTALGAYFPFRAGSGRAADRRSAGGQPASA